MSLSLELTVFNKLFAGVAEEMGGRPSTPDRWPQVTWRPPNAWWTLFAKPWPKALPRTIPAASQGTMNNLAFGGKRSNGEDFTYYETIAGDMGGAPGHPGLDGVHTHMTNTRNTPVEALEQEYPLLIERYALRGNSASRGRYAGGRRVQRDFRFLSQVTLSLLTERRRLGLRGLRAS
jgi:N-methylhydantoinase B/oxoprolinase/acetone carboxylase alpha subunit